MRVGRIHLRVVLSELIGCTARHYCQRTGKCVCIVCKGKSWLLYVTIGARGYNRGFSFVID